MALKPQSGHVLSHFNFISYESIILSLNVQSTRNLRFALAQASAFLQIRVEPPQVTYSSVSPMPTTYVRNSTDVVAAYVLKVSVERQEKGAEFACLELAG